MITREKHAAGMSAALFVGIFIGCLLGMAVGVKLTTTGALPPPSFNWQPMELAPPAPTPAEPPNRSRA